MKAYALGKPPLTAGDLSFDTSGFIRDLGGVDTQDVGRLLQEHGDGLRGRVLAVLADDPKVIVDLLQRCILDGISLALFRSASDLEREVRSPGCRPYGGVWVEGQGLEMLSDTPKSVSPPVVFLLTSGTTGRPVLHGWDLLALTSGFGTSTKPGKWLLTYHPASFAGLQVALTAALANQQLVSSSGRSVPELARLAQLHATDCISGTPTFWRAFLRSVAHDAQRLDVRVATLGGEVVEQDLLDKIRRVFPNATLRHIYASTELGPVLTVKDGRAGFPEAWLARPPGRFRLAVRDGRLFVARDDVGPRSDLDAWFDTGDNVEVAGDRVLFRGRSSVVANVGGVKVAIESVESMVKKYVLVQDVRVHTVPSPVVGQLLAADVVVDDATLLDVDELIRWLSIRLPREAIPRRWRVVDRIPLTAAGKKDRVSS